MFSIITICYNAEKHIARVMESVLYQRYTNFEYILVDGGSKDSTNQIIESYKEKFQKKGILVTHISEKDKGISDAFNKGICLAKGDIIGIINSDDELEKDALEKVDKAFNESNADIVYGNCLWIDETNGIEYIRKSSKYLKDPVFDLVIMHPATYIKKSTYDKYGMYDISFKKAMDWELLARMFVNNVRFYYIDEVLAIFHAGGVSDGALKNDISEALRIAEMHGVSREKFEKHARRNIKLNMIKDALKKSGPVYTWLKKVKDKMGRKK